MSIHMKYRQIILTSYCHEKIDAFSTKTKKSYCHLLFWSVFIANFLSLTWYVIFLPLQINMKVFKKEIVFASKQWIFGGKMYCAVGKEMPWGRMKNEFRNDSPLRYQKVCSTRSQYFFLCTDAWSTLGSSSIQGILLWFFPDK